MNRAILSSKSENILKEGGVLVPSPLALNHRKEVMENYQRLLTLYYIKSGAKAVIPGAHTGEFSLNDIGIFENWLVWVKEMTDTYGSGMILMAAIGGANAVQQAELAAKYGYDIVLVAPTAFAGKNYNEVVSLFKDIASLIPTFAFELQRAIPGSYVFTGELWDKIFEIVYGGKGASFDTYRSLEMLEAAARSSRIESLSLYTGNDDRIVNDLLGKYSYKVNNKTIHLQYNGGLLGHFATDTHAVVKWVDSILEKRRTGNWTFELSEQELSHGVNRCNSALFDALNNFENSVWGVKYRLTSLGLLPAPICESEIGRNGQAESIDKIYGEYPSLCDNIFVKENIEWMKKEVGIHGGES